MGKIGLFHPDYKDTKQDIILNWSIAIILIILGFISLYPLYIVLISSFSDPSAISRGEVFLFPKGINVDAYKTLLETKEIWIGYRNSIFYTVVGTTMQMIITTSAAFVLAQITLPGRNFFILFFLFPMYFTGGLIPTYMLIRKLGMVNTVWALLIPTLVGPYNLILCRNFFERSIPGELMEAARIDGCNLFRYFAQIAVPLAKPVLAVMVLNFALGHWNNYMNAMIYITNDNIQTLQVFIKRITMQAISSLDTGSGITDFAEIANQIRKTQLLKYAVVIVSSLPMISLYPFIQKYFIKGMMVGSVKE